MLKKINKMLILDEYEIKILNDFGININGKTTIDEILFLIDSIENSSELTDEELAILDNIADNISERKYYNYTNK
jgi:transcription initiation factor IIE alpha subunit